MPRYIRQTIHVLNNPLPSISSSVIHHLLMSLREWTLELHGTGLTTNIFLQAPVLEGRVVSYLKMVTLGSLVP